jgi:hypothetical protein
VRVEGEIFRLEMFGRLIVGKIVQQNRAQNRALGLYVRRKTVRETVISGCQNILLRQKNYLEDVSAIVTAEDL